MKLRFLVFSIVALYGVFMQVSEGQEATNAASFLKIGAGAKATALGGAFVAVADDASAIYWNSAGLAQLKGPIISLADRTPSLDTNYAGIAIASPIWSMGFIGLNILYYDCSDINMYDSHGVNTGTLDDKESAVILSYAYNLSQLLVGINGKYIYQNMNADDIGSTAFNGVGVDISVLYKILKHLAVGATFHSKYKMTNTDDDTLSSKSPLNIRAGAYYNINMGRSNSLNFMMDFDQTKSYPLKLNLGTELVLYDSLALRAGLANIYAETKNSSIDYLDLLKYNVRPTVGLGLKLKIGPDSSQSAIIFDYALSLEKLGMRNFFTLSYQF
jgi:long-subunit fatty acid transport protein